jgi:hypothetical protein
VPLALPPDAKGILPDRMIAAMADAGAILPAYPFIESQIQPASLDLRLGDVAYRVRASFLPGPGATVADRIEDLKLHEISLSDGAVLETNCVYIVPLIESLALPPTVAAAANPKSSTGRLDVFTRVIADGTRRFDMMTTAITARSTRRFRRRLSRCCCAKARACRKSDSAKATPRSMARRLRRCMRRSGWSTATRPI